MLAFQHAGITIDDVTVHRPTLDEVFFALTGKTEAVDGAELSLAGVAS